MAILEIHKYGSPILREVASPVKKVNREIKRLLDDLAETMYAAKGVGLAANQVGILRRVVVVDVSLGKALIQLVNPVEIGREGEVSAVEGCLSVPQYTGEVVRAKRISVRGLGKNGQRVWVEAGGWLARAIQHELDHLDGRLFLDRAVKLMDTSEA